MSASTATCRATQRRWDYLPAFATEQLPRYTSYPPANRFAATIGPAHAAEALARLPDGAELSLYIHIPFCKKLCWYCGCHTSVPTISDPVDAYLDAVMREIETVAASTPSTVRVSHLHFGGGSPDILEPAQIERLFKRLRGAFAFTRFPKIAAELDPRGVTADTIHAYVAEGLNRVSLGVQVLDPGVQRRINRIQPAADIANSVRLLRDAGVEGINADLMYGLPGQTMAHVVESATFAAMQDIDRVAVFGYAHVPWMKRHQKSIRVEDLPAGEERFRQAEAASRTLEQAGYLAVGFDHFAAPGDSLAAASLQGRLRRNFQGYTDDDAIALIGFGASAISSLPGLIYQNAPDTAAYREAASAGQMPVVRGTALSREDRQTSRLIERILCDFEAALPAGFDATRLSALVDSGLIELRAQHLTVTAVGRPYVRNVAACFDPEFAPQPNRHSLAI